MNQFNDNFLNSMRLVADKEADSLIKELIKRGELTELREIFGKIVYNSEIKSENLPPNLSDYFKENSKLPKFTDPNLIARAQNAFRKFGPSIILSYFHKSLPECYACGMGAEVLGMTGRLTNHTRRRIAQTAQFVMDVMSPGGLEPGGRGISSALKVRIVHASIRYYIKKAVSEGKAKYDYDSMGLPINQEDLAGTMLAFSVTVILGLEKLGIKIDDDEKEAVLHLWKVVGHLIGIRTEIMPLDYAQGKELWDKITSRLFLKTAAGVELNNDLINMLEDLIPAKRFDGVIYLIMNHIMNQKARDLLEVKTNYQHKFATFLLGLLLDIFLKFDSNGSFSRFFTNHINMHLMNGLKEFVSKDENIEIYVPPGLHKDWEQSHEKSRNFLGVR